MKLTATMATITMAAFTMISPAVGAQGESENTRQVTVYLSNSSVVPVLERALAQGIASNMFAGIGVTLHWKCGSPPLSGPAAISIEFATDTPATLLPGAFAYALPYEGVHIRIFWDRMKPARSPLDFSPREILAHVMVHEITHVLQGVDRHSAEGIMKARWNDKDRSAMKLRPLRFTPEDVELIYNGMDGRGPHSPKSAAPTAITAGAELGVQGYNPCKRTPPGP